ncbi:MAG TPA: extradiol ring-cleavage dioxygenase, partial [Chloroflexota bacterium]|nr:extradiol ring-cleavage dioxygenase [Chloroflexota bacterium]
DTTIKVPGHKQAANGLTRYLLDEGFDVAYALQTRHPRGLSHSFANAIIYLDFDQRGFDYPLIPFHVNCYGNQLMTTSAGTVGESTGELSPPAPSPRRCFEIGRATARFFQDSPWRVALIASSSWSHGSLTLKHKRMYPDVEADRRRYAELTGGRLSDWAKLDIAQIEDSGEHELLNWICLAGAMTEAGQEPTYTEMVESYIFNSTKTFAIFEPPPAASAIRTPAAAAASA